VKEIKLHLIPLREESLERGVKKVRRGLGKEFSEKGRGTGRGRATLVVKKAPGQEKHVLQNGSEPVC